MFQLFEIIINIIDIALIYWFFRVTLGYRKTWFFQLLAAFLFFCLPNIVFYFRINIFVARVIYLLGLQLWAGFLCKGSFPQRLVIASLPQLFSLIADSVLLLFIKFSKILLSNALEPNLTRLSMSLLFLFIMAFLYLLVAWPLAKTLRLSDVSFTPLTYFCFYLVLLTAFAGWEVLFNIQLHNRIDSAFSPLWISILFLFIVLVFFCVFILYGHQRNQLETQALLLEKNQLDQQQFEQLLALENLLCQEKHDSESQLLSLIQLLESNAVASALALLKEKQDIFLQTNLLPWTTRPAINALIATQKQLAESRGITVIIRIDFRGPYPLPDSDLFCILSNLLTNAREATELAANNAKLSLEIKQLRSCLCICIQNTSRGIYQRDHAQQFISTKKASGHGLGLKAVSRLVNKYDGILNLEAKDFQFRAVLFFPLAVSQSNFDDSLSENSQEIKR